MLANSVLLPLVPTKDYINKSIVKQLVKDKKEEKI